jgi:hypothetical protein
MADGNLAPDCVSGAQASVEFDGNPLQRLPIPGRTGYQRVKVTLR